MYVTRPRALYRSHPGALSERPQSDALYSGTLVVSDEESEALDSFCCGIWTNNRIGRLPFPSDKILKVVHSTLHDDASITKVWFVPVPDQPLSSNRYYVIKAHGRRKGQAYTCSRGEDTRMCCFNRPQFYDKIRPFDHRDRYQQLEIRPYPNGGFFAQSVEWDGYPPTFLRRGGWQIYTSNSSIHLHLPQAPGLHSSTSLDPPPLDDFLLHSKRSIPVLIGKWYCPFVFIKEEDVTPREQMRKSMIYELSVKLWWEKIYWAENVNSESFVAIDTRVKRLICLVHGLEGGKDNRGKDGEGFVWFRVGEGYGRRVNGVGLSSGLLEKMKWAQGTRGWFEGDGREVRVSERKEIRSGTGWRKFGCYVLVESFALRRMDGGLLISFNFRNIDKIEYRCE